MGVDDRCRAGRRRSGGAGGRPSLQGPPAVRGASRPDKQIVSLGGNVLEPLWPWLGVCVCV